MATPPTIAVIGLGAAGTALAADLAGRGVPRILAHDVDLALVASVRLAGGVRVEGMGGPVLSRVTLPGSSAAAVARADVVFVATTADAHHAVARDVAAALRPGTVVVLYCGYVGGTLVFRRALAEAGADPDAVTVVETMNTIHLCGAMAPGRVFVSAMKRWLEVTGPTPDDTATALDRLGGLLPELVPGRHLLETGLNNPNPIGHVPAATFGFALMDAADGPATTGVLASSMEAAVRSAAELARPGDVVLLSPGCASFDWYTSYEERGDDFVDNVRRVVLGEGVA
jgi:hypothetical protein